MLTRENNSSPSPHPNQLPEFREWILRMLPALLFCGLAMLILKTAWLEEDAFITFRTVDNFIHGYGLRWNIAERVQTYTHPLWMFVLSAGYFLTRDVSYTALALSLAFSMAAVWLVAFRMALTPVHAVTALLALLFSQAFIHYSTSGLENPLTHLLLAVFFWLYFASEHQPRRLPLLFLIACLGVLNRMDTLLLFAPALTTLTFRHGMRLALPAAALGFLPLIAWGTFSLFYYGLLVPNTAYAKLSTGIPRPELLAQGAAYLVNSLRWDTITLFTISLATVGVVLHRAWPLLAPVLGILTYLVYVINVGGDYMTGRFLSAPLFVAAIVLTRLPWPSPRQRGAIIAAFLAVGFISPLTPVLGKSTLAYDHGIRDKRAYHVAHTGLWNLRFEDGVLQHPWAMEGAALKDEPPGVHYRSSVGLYGFHAGPNVHILDPYALADPLLARMPTALPQKWRIGHFTRAIPPGYTQTLRTGTIQLHDPELTAWYRDIAMVTRDPLFSASRLRAIGRLYLSPPPEKDRAYKPDAPREIPIEVTEDFRVYRKARNNHLVGKEGPLQLFVHQIPAEGLTLMLPTIEPTSEGVVLLLEEGRSFRVALRRNGHTIETKILPSIAGNGFTTHYFPLPDTLLNSDYHELVLLPLDGQESYLGQARLSLSPDNTPP